MNWLLRAFPYDEALGATRTVYASVRGFVTRPDETGAAPNTYWDRRIEVPLSETASLFDGDAVGGRSTASLGAVRISNSDGAIDGWLDWNWDGRVVELYRTDLPSPRYLSDFTLITRRTVDDIVPGDEIELVLTDAQARFSAPARRGTFAGTGGIEGTASLKGRAKPFCLGRVRRIEPVLIDAEANIYMIDPAGIHALPAADDGGAPFTIGHDLADYAELKALDMTSLDLVTAKAAGLVRLSEKPSYRFRVTAEGVAPGGTWIYKAGDLVKHAAQAFAGLVDGEIDASSIAALNSLQPGVLGYWYDGAAELTAEALIDRIMDGIGGFWGVSTAGLLQVGRYDLPAAIASATIRRRDMIDLTPQQAPRRVKRVRLSYRPGLALTEQEIAGGISATDRELATQDREWTAEAVSTTTTAQSLLAVTLEKDTLFDAVADAEAERDRLLALLSVRRQPFDIVVPLSARFESISIGATIEIFDTRFGLAGGRRVVVLRRVADTGANIPTLTLTVL